jgi:hypothetical protein
MVGCRRTSGVRVAYLSAILVSDIGLKEYPLVAQATTLDQVSDILRVTTAAVLVLLEDALDNQDSSAGERVTLLQNLHSELTAAKARLDG